MRISVCIATYNGAAYLPAQLQSIQTQLTAEDEIIIADDASSDNTCALIEALQDSRIRLLAGRERCGHVARFAEALQAAEGDILMLADQDDIWLPGRVEAIRKALSQPGVLLVAGQFEQMNAVGEPLPPPERKLRAADSQRWLANIVAILWGRRPYYGCAMAFKRPLLALALPVPRATESHDLWLALAANSLRAVYHLEQPLLRKRQHAHNVSHPRRRPWPKLIRSRWGMLCQLREIYRRRRHLPPPIISHDRAD